MRRLLVLLLVLEGSSILLTGDVGGAAERHLTEQGSLDVDLLKAAHHGSRYSSSQAFLDWCDPEIALVSCSERNTYGHPHVDTLARLAEAGCQVYGTSASGTIRAAWDRNGEMCLWHWQ